MYRRIRDLREDSDLTQKSLADYLSCSQVCYSNYETGKRDVPSDVLISSHGFTTRVWIILWGSRRSGLLTLKRNST